MIVRYKGGLGNQMFQYALRCNMEKAGYDVMDDLSSYRENPPSMPFKLTEVFQNIILKETQEDISHIIEKSNARKLWTKIFNTVFPVTRRYYCERKALFYDKNVLKMKYACVEGYWQAAQYAKNVEEMLFERFEFPTIQNKEILSLIDQMEKGNSVSVHIRAGDYLTAENSAIFGGICTTQYYRNAIKQIEKEVKNPVFFVFSNDTEWCKENFQLDHVIWMDEDVLQPHEDWIEMYLMSCCKHNIIANSSFSWWSAFLNKNREKIVIAPGKWMNDNEGRDICPKEWKRI